MTRKKVKIATQMMCRFGTRRVKVEPRRGAPMCAPDEPIAMPNKARFEIKVLSQMNYSPSPPIMEK